VRVLLLLVGALVAPLAFAQVTTPKPAVFANVTSAAQYPDHCYFFNEGAGSTVEDECGVGGDLDLTITGADWGTDGTHGDKLSFVAANSDRAVATGISGLTAVTWCIVMHVAMDPAAAQTPIGFGDTAQNTSTETRIGTNGNLTRRAIQNGGTAANGTGSSDVVMAGGYNLVCGDSDDVNVAVNLNGGNRETTMHGFTGMMAALDKFTIGAENDTALTEYADIEVIAAWTYGSVKDNTARAAIYNGGNPWIPIGAIATGSAKARRRH
jgi:hypothetical protein